jgi:trimethylamine--corrinoid protein Co-methyltransferase
MRSGAYAAGAVETGIAAAALAQLGRHYGYPTGSYLGLTNAKLADAQAGVEKAMSPTLAAAAGIDFVVVGGLLDALLAFDFGQLVLDDEMALMIKRFRQDLRFDGLDGVVEEIAAAGPGGMFADHRQTLQLMKTAAFLPAIADRERREVWEAGGRRDAHARALDRAKRLMCEDAAACLDAEADARIRAAFPGLVAGDAVVPEHWRAAAGNAPRGRRTGRRQPRAV